MIEEAPSDAPHASTSGNVRAEDKTIMSSLDERSAQDAELDAAGPTPQAVRASPSPLPAIGPLTLDFLAWVGRRSRSYAETMEAWRTNCPRFMIWEDALGDGLVRLERDGTTRRGSNVVLTPRGRALLDGA